MNIKEIQALITTPEYDFLRTNPHLKDKMILLTLGGSYAYGTNIATSDIDIRGCALNSISDLLGLSNFEQVVNNTTDTTIYSFNKLISLLLNCNPNVIEILGCKPEHYLFLSDIGQELINNQRLFLSKRAVHSFGGYANQQLRRLENALAHDALPQFRREEHILNSLISAKRAFEGKYSDLPEGSIYLFTDCSNRDDMDTEIFANISLQHYPARQFNSIINDLHNVLSTYDKLNHRNNKKDNAHLNKHAMHLIRLYHMCFDILEKEQIITYRLEDHDLLMAIRNGEYQKEDGTYKQEFFDMIKDYEKRLAYDKANTSLPEHPNMGKIEEFVMDINRRSINE